MNPYRHPLSALCALFFTGLFFGCAHHPDLEFDALKHAARIRSADPVAVMVSVPNVVTYSRLYDTTREMSVESRDVSAPLMEVEAAMATELAWTLKSLVPSMAIRESIGGGSLVDASLTDPRKKGRFGYALILPEELSSLPREWTEQWEIEQAAARAREPKDDPKATTWLFAAQRPFGNGDQQFFQTLHIDQLVARTKARYLIWSAVDSIHAIDRVTHVQVVIQFRTRVLDLVKKRLVLEYLHSEDGTRPDAMTGRSLQSLPDIAALQQDRASLLRRALGKSAKRYGIVLAAQMAYLPNDVVEQHRRQWSEQATHPDQP